MTFRKGLLTTAILLFLMSSLAGCNLIRYIDGSTQEEIEQKENPVLWKKTADLEGQNQLRQAADVDLSNRISNLQGSLSKVETSLKQMEVNVGQITAGLPMEATSGATPSSSAKKGILAALRDDTAQVNERVKRLEENGAALREDLETIKTAVLPIKVLSGTGKRASARKMALRLSKLGYRVDRIDLASRKSYKQNVVFFRESYREAAVKLAARIGSGTVVRPMTWRSQYGIIIVSAMR
ncbi:MAG: LytR C-terminal domain-containing protein [Deltaproteobacteria bacterium]|nr:LytR C-terminal domain-containing protein [Deltaproteobacteria bacterium]